MDNKKRKYTVTVIPDDEGELFSMSSCECSECKSMHSSQLEWLTFKPETQLQKQMISVIAKIEKDIKNGFTSNIRKIPKKLINRKKRRK